MFKKPVKPKKASLLFTLLIAITAYLGSQASPVFGYYVALLTMVALILASYTNSFWPSKEKAENPLVFSLFWGLVIGGLVPFVAVNFAEGGMQAVFDIFKS
ncbi:hypothetical protein [Rhodohalobacter mucosus]|uniref:Uncharacterized protein n=1 Tax=Rhodohalobacter mucosus TaxID=2079485 RepID=A0A316TSX7_9BACT|nr:hypothetical protein [Rhodohalobacter mucosus]PWN06968.1 hypothetical protein DDZ15_06760 [Rhodohalobacter mucosus]